MKNLKVYKGSIRSSEGFELLNPEKTRCVAFTVRKQDANHIAKCVNFVNHIEKHLKEQGIKSHNGKVVCKICNKTIDKIYEVSADSSQP